MFFDDMVNILTRLGAWNNANDAHGMSTPDTYGHDAR